MMFCNADDIAFTMPTDEDRGEEFDDVDDEAERFEMAPTFFSFCLSTATAVAALALALELAATLAAAALLV